MKRIFSSFLVLLFCLVYSTSAFATTQKIDYVTDEVGMLTEQERVALNNQAESVSMQYNCGVYVYIIDDYTHIGENVTDAAQNLYSIAQLGWGSDASGVLLFLSMAERDYTLLAKGYGNEAFTDYGKEVLSGEFLGDFSSNAWNSGLSHYISYSEEMLSLAQAGTPVDVPTHTLASFAISLALAGIVTACICMALYAQMRKVAHGFQADTYTTDGGLQVINQKDTFTHRTEQRVKIEKPSSNKPGGGTTINGGGFSSRSGKF